MVTNTPIDKESFRLTQAAQKVQELLNLIQNLSDSGYTNDLQSLVDVITNWDDTDDSTSFAAQLQKIFTNFLSKQEILPKILSTGETYQTDVNGQTESLGADMPVQSSVIYDAFKEYGIRQLPNGSSWYEVDGKPGYYTATFGSQSTPSEDGLYLYSNTNGANSTNRNLDSIYLVDKNGELFGGAILNGLIANTAAIIKITHTGGAEVIFEAQHTGDYLEQQVVDSLPERTITSDFSSATSYQFTSDNKSTVALTTQDNYQCQMITATGNLSTSYYSTASFDFSSIIDKVKYLTVEFDSKIPNMRWYIALVNSTYRPGTSAASAYDDSGVAFKQGVETTTNYMINNVLTTNTDMYNHWVHTKLIVDVENKKVNYIITQTGTENKLEGTSSYLDNSSHTNTIDKIEVYTWATGNNIYIANVSITAFDDTTNKTIRYLLPENNGAYSEYVFDDGAFIQIGNTNLVDGNYVPYYDKPSEESIDLNTLTSTGFYAIQTGQGQQDHCPSLNGADYWESGVVIVGCYDEGCTQMFLNYAVDNDPNSSTMYPAAIAIRTLDIGDDNVVKVSSDWKIISSNTQNWSVNDSNNTLNDVDLNTLTNPGVYSVYASQAATVESCHFPCIGDSTSMEGSLLVAQNLDGCTQMYMNYGNDVLVDNLYIPFVAFRTLNYSSNSWTVDSDWKIINLNTINKVYLDEVFLSKCIDYDTVFGNFPKLTLNSLFVLKNDIADYTSTKILVNDEVGYKLNTTIQPNTSYLATVTKYPETGADHLDGTIHIYGALDNGSKNDNESNLEIYSTTPQRIGTWVDGKSILRVCWDTTVTSLMKDDGLTNIFDLSGVKYEKRIILNAVCIWLPQNDYAIQRILNLEDNNNSKNSGVFVIPDEAVVGEKLYGYVEYIDEIE